MVGVGGERQTGAAALVEFVNGDVDLAGEQLDREVRSHLPGTVVRIRGLRGRLPPDPDGRGRDRLEVRVARAICGLDTYARLSWKATIAG